MNFFFKFFSLVQPGTVEPENIRFLHKKMIDTGRDQESFFMNPSKGFYEVKKNNFAFLCEEPTANRYIRKIFKPQQICHVKKISFRRNDLVGIIVKKHSPLRERFLINFLWMTEVGIVHKVDRHWNGMKLRCEQNDHFHSVRIQYVAPALMLLAFIHFLSIVILISEVLIKKLNGRRKRKMNKHKHCKKQNFRIQ